MLLGEFKTAYLQREVYVDATVTEDLVVNQLVVLTPKSGSTPASISAASTAKEATHILAQSDVTATPYDRVPTELGRYDGWNYQKVAAPTDDVPYEWKHIALYKITDFDDIIVTEV